MLGFTQKVSCHASLLVHCIRYAAIVLMTRHDTTRQLFYTQLIYLYVYIGLSSVVISSSPPLALFFYHNVQCSRSLVYIFAYVFVPVTVCTCVRIDCTPRLRCLSRPPTQFPTWFHLFATVWLEVTWPPLCSNWGRDFWSLFKSDVVE